MGHSKPWIARECASSGQPESRQHHRTRYAVAVSLPDRAELSTTASTDLLALYAAIVDELRARGVVRSSNNPVGDYGEYLTARAFGLTLEANSAIGFDAVGPDGIRYQVKTRRLTAENTSRQLSFIRGFADSTEPFDFLVGILFDADFTVRRAALVPVAVVRANAARVERVNAWRIMLRDGIWTTPGVEDITDRIRAAAEAAPLPVPRAAAVPLPRPAARHAVSAARRALPEATRRSVKTKADPAEVRAYFAATGLSRRELAGIVGTGVGVIATVQNPNGDRWSVERFERARVLIDDHLAARNASATDA